MPVMEAEAGGRVPAYKGLDPAMVRPGALPWGGGGRARGAVEPPDPALPDAPGLQARMVLEVLAVSNHWGHHSQWALICARDGACKGARECELRSIN